MRTKVFILIALNGFSIQAVTAQEKEVIYLTWIELLEGQKPVKGYLKDLQDSAIVVLGKKTDSIYVLHVDKIDKLSFRKEKKLKNSTLTGAVVSGLLLGLITSQQN